MAKLAASEPLLDANDVAARLKVSEHWVRRAVWERKIPFLKVGGHLRFDPVRIEAWIDALNRDPAA